MSQKDKSGKSKLRDRAFGQMAEEFSESSRGTGEALGRATLMVATVIEKAVASPKLVKLGWEEIKEKIQPLLQGKLANTPPERIQSPPMMIAGPTLESLRFTYDQDELCEMFSNLLVTSMDRDRAHTAHPAFVQIINQLTPDEANILIFWKRKQYTQYPVINVTSADKGEEWKGIPMLENYCNIGRDADILYPNLVTSYISNICRLEIAEIPFGISLSDKQQYKSLEKDPSVLNLKEEIEQTGRVFKVDQRVLTTTPFGRQFMEACISVEPNKAQ